MQKRKLAVCAYESLETKGGISVFIKNLIASTPVSSKYEILFLGSDQFQLLGRVCTKILLPLRLFWNLYQYRPDIIHVHDHEQTLIAALMYKFAFPRTNMIYTHHTMPVEKKFIEEKKYHSPRQGVIKKKVFSYLMKKCNYVTCVSQSLRDQIIQYGVYLDLAKTSILHGATTTMYPTDIEIEAVQDKWNLENYYPVLCMVSVLAWDSKVAGVIKLLEAVVHLKSDYPDIKLILVGDGEFRSYVEEKIAALALNEHVLLTGAVDDPSPIVSASDIYCHISLNEALGLAILEAMAIGKPVIASNLGGIPEVIDHEQDGLLVETEPAKIAASISRLLHDRKMAQDLGANAREKIRMKFTWDICGESFAKLYDLNASDKLAGEPKWVV